MNDIEWINKCIEDAEKNDDSEMLEYFHDMLNQITEN